MSVKVFFCVQIISRFHFPITPFTMGSETSKRERERERERERYREREREREGGLRKIKCLSLSL